MYGKIIDGKMIRSPQTLVIDGDTYINPPASVLIRAGYVPLEFTPVPDSEKSYQETWSIVNGKGVQGWEESATPKPTVQALEASVKALQHENEVLMECLLEMSEIVYA